MTPGERALLQTVYNSQAACLLGAVRFFAALCRRDEFMPWQEIERARKELDGILKRKQKEAA